MTSTKNAPKKYADARSTIITDEWLTWKAEQHESECEGGWLEAAHAGYDPAMFFPEKDGKAIPDDGAWILVIEEPNTELKSRFRVPPISMWRARRHELSDSPLTTSTGAMFFPQQAAIATPAGDLHLWPHEYIIAARPMELAANPDAELHSLGGQPVLNEDELFYLQSRGIPRSTAVMMLFDKVVSFDFVYVTFPEEITDVLAGAGRPLHRHIALNPR